MKTVACAMLLIAAFMLVGCSEKSTPIAGPNDQASGQIPSVQKNIPLDFTWNMTSLNTIPNAGFQKFPDGNTILRGRLDNASLDASTDLLDGDVLVELNGTVDLVSYTGEFWGKATVTTTKPAADGGVWEFSWHGKGALNFGTGMWEIPLQEQGYGKGGNINGMHCFCDHMITAAADFSTWTGHAEGYIKTH